MSTAFQRLKDKSIVPSGEFTHHWADYDLPHPSKQDVFNIDDWPNPLDENNTLRVYTNSQGEFHYPSVTTMIGVVGDVDGDESWLQEWRDRVGEEEAERIVAEAIAMGNSMHDCAEKYLLNEEISKKHIRGFNLFTELRKELDKIEGVILCEHALVSPRLGLAGRIDCFALEFDGMPFVTVDFKTSRREKLLEDVANYNIQVALYSLMIKDMIGIEPELGTILMMVWNKKGTAPFLKRFDVIIGSYREQAFNVVVRYHEIMGNDFDVEKQRSFFLD